MSNNEQKDGDIKSAPSGKMMLLIFATIADTSARLFIPSVGGVVLGLWADKTLDTTPILTILGVVFGSLMAFMLVYLQIKRVNK